MEGVINLVFPVLVDLMKGRSWSQWGQLAAINETVTLPWGCNCTRCGSPVGVSQHVGRNWQGSSVTDALLGGAKGPRRPNLLDRDFKMCFYLEIGTKTVNLCVNTCCRANQIVLCSSSCTVLTTSDPPRGFVATEPLMTKSCFVLVVRSGLRRCPPRCSA